MTEPRGSTATADREPQPAAGGRGGRRRGLGGLGLYYRQVVAELRKVNWPSRAELLTYTVVALVFVTVMVIIVAVLDIAFAKGVLQIFG